MTIIDVGAHFEPSANWLDEFPALKKKLPAQFPTSDPRFPMNSAEMFAYFVSDDLLRAVPPEQRMPIDRLTTPAMTVMFSPGASALVIGEYALPLRPSEYVRRNIRLSPLPAPHESPVAMLEALPEVPVFSSDYPHFEGSSDPVEHYDKELASLDVAMRDRFLSGNIAASYALMGDPL